MTKAIAEILDVSPNALTVPDIDSDFGLVHTLFALEDRKLLRIENQNGLVYLRANPSGGLKAEYLNQALCAWYEQYARLQAGEITKEEYNNWRYHYPYHEENKWTYRASRHSGQE